MGNLTHMLRDITPKLGANMLIAVINESMKVSNNDVDLMCKAIQIQLDAHLLPAWHIKSSSISFHENKTKIPDNVWVISLLDDQQTATALGYDSNNKKDVDSCLFCEPVLDIGGVILHDPGKPKTPTIAAMLSHEVCEMICDPYAVLWADGPKLAQGSEYALEACDPVDGDYYPIQMNNNGIPSTVTVSNFVYPSWFTPDATSSNMPFDHLKLLTGPFTMNSSGAMILRNAGVVTTLFGAKMPQWKQAIKKSTWYRR